MSLRSSSIPTILLLLILSLLLLPLSFSFQSDELLLDDDEFGLEGGIRIVHSPNPNPNPNSNPGLSKQKVGTRRRETESDSKVQFELEHGFGESEWESAGVFTARIKSWSHGGQTLTKLRFSRNSLTDAEKEKFKELIEKDDFYKIRLPSNVLSPPGRNYTVSSVRVRCLVREALDEHIVIHMEGVNILAVNYGSPGACPYPRQQKLPAKWLFNSHSTLKYSEMASRTPVFTEEALLGENAEGEIVKPPEKSFWAKYWMYILPLGLIIMNAVTQAVNMPEEQAAGRPGQQQSGAAVARGAGGAAAVRRR